MAADLLNDRVLSFFAEHSLPLLRILTDRGTEYCGAREHYEYQLYLAVENIDHSRTKARHPQTNGICERFHKTMQDEFYATAFRKTLYTCLEQLQADLDAWWRITTPDVRTREDTALARRRCRRSSTRGKLAWDKVIGRETPAAVPEFVGRPRQIKSWLIQRISIGRSLVPHAA